MKPLNRWHNGLSSPRVGWAERFGGRSRDGHTHRHGHAERARQCRSCTHSLIRRIFDPNKPDSHVCVGAPGVRQPANPIGRQNGCSHDTVPGGACPRREIVDPRQIGATWAALHPSPAPCSAPARAVRAFRAGVSRPPLRALALCLSLLWCAIGPAPVLAQDGRYSQFATTQSYLDAPENLRNGYVAGMLDTVIAHGIGEHPINSCVLSMRLQDIRADFDLWLRNRPVDWRYSLPTNFLVAIRGFCE